MSGSRRADDEAAMALRGATARALVSGVRDDGATQTLDAETHEGVGRSAVEVLQPYGLATSPPEGAVTVVLAVGGDQGDMVALPPACPDSRFGRLAPGEVALYDARGNRVHLRAGGAVEVHAAASVAVSVGGGPVMVVTASGVSITGDLTVTGQVSDARGSMQEMRDVYNGHTNPSNGGNPPPQKMT